MKEYLTRHKDVLGIWWRLKEIDRNYDLMLNKKLNRLEVHNVCQIGPSLVCVASPCDARLVKKIYLTRRENAQKFFKQLEKENERRRICAEQRIIFDAQARAEEIARYSFITNRDLTENEMKKILNY